MTLNAPANIKVTELDKARALRSAVDAWIAALEAPATDNPNTGYLRTIERNRRWLAVCEAADDLFEGDLLDWTEIARRECGFESDPDTPAYRFDGNPSLGRLA